MNKPILAVLLIFGIIITGAVTISGFSSENIFHNNRDFYHHGGEFYEDEDNESFRHHYQFDDNASYERLYLHLNEEDRELVDSEYSSRIIASDFSELNEKETTEVIQSIKDDMVEFINTNILDTNNEEGSYRRGCPAH